MNRVPGTIVAAFLIAAPLTAQPPAGGAPSGERVPSSLTLPEAIAIALRNNGTYVRLLNDAEVNEANKRSAFARLLPIPSGSFSTGATPSRSQGPFGSNSARSSSTNLSFGLGLTVFDGGQTLNGYRQTKSVIERSALELTTQEITLRANIISQYFQTQLADSAVAVELRILAARKQELEVANIRFLKALITPLNQDRAVESVVRAENSVLNARDALAQRKLTLLNAMGLSGEPNFSLVTPIPTFGDSVRLNADSLIGVAMQRNPGLRQQHLALDQTYANARLTRNRRFMPSVRINASYGRGTSESDYTAFFDPSARSSSMSGSLSFTFSFTQLLDFTSTSATLKQSSAQVEDAVSALRDQTQNLELQVKLAVNSLNGAYRQLRFARETVARTKVQVLVANNELLAATINPFDHQAIMDGAAAAERELLTQQLNVLNRTTELDRLLGNLPGGGL